MEEVYTVYKNRMVDIDSMSIDVYNDSDNLIATGQYSIRTNWCHIRMEEEYDDGIGLIEEKLVRDIENRQLIIQ